MEPTGAVLPDGVITIPNPRNTPFSPWKMSSRMARGFITSMYSFKSSITLVRDGKWATSGWKSQERVNSSRVVRSYYWYQKLHWPNSHQQPRCRHNSGRTQLEMSPSRQKQCWYVVCSMPWHRITTALTCPLQKWRMRCRKKKCLAPACRYRRNENGHGRRKRKRKS